MRTILVLVALLLPCVAAAQGSGTIKGTVTDAVTHAPIEGVKVSMDFGPAPVSMLTNAAGMYEATVAAGSYSVRATKLDYVSTYYPNTECRRSCTVPPSSFVPAGGTLTADFSLRPLSSISGVLSDSITGLPIVSKSGLDVSVRSITSSGLFDVPALETDASGRYTLHNLEAGTYYVRASATGYVEELYDNFPCVSTDCRALSGTPVTVGAASTRTGIDLALDPQGFITGTVRAASGGAGIGIELTLYNAATSQVAVKHSSINDSPPGIYTFSGLPQGDYYIRAGSDTSTTQYVPQLYGGIPCRPQVGDVAGCRIASGARVHVNTGSTTSGVDFLMTKAGSTSGTVRHSDNGGPFADASVEVFDGAGWRAGARTGADGRFVVIGLPPGRYHARAFATGFVTTIRDGSISIAAGEDTPNIDFSLGADAGTGGAIKGTIRYDLGTGPSLIGWRYGGGGTIAAYDAHGRFVKNAELTISGSGPFIVTDPIPYTIDGLPDGSYFLRYEVQAGHDASVYQFYHGSLVEEIYGAGACVTVDCDVRRGLPIVVVNGGIVANIDFDLKRGASIGLVLPTDEVYDARGVRVDARRYESRIAFYGFDQVTGLPPGTYYVRRPGGLLNGGIECADCPATAAKPITRGLGGVDAENASFAAGSRSISGTVRASSGGAPLSTITVTAYSESGTAEVSVLTDMLGNYTIEGLAPGQYFLKTSNERGYVDKAYPATACPDCDPRSATAVDITAGAATGKDLALDDAALIEGTVTDRQGVSLGSLPVAFFDGAGAFAGRVRARKSGTFAMQLPAGTYHARSDAAPGYTALLFNDRPCPQGNCDPRGGNPIAASLSIPAKNIDFALAVCAAPTVSPAVLASGVKGVAYRQVLASSDGVPPYRYTVVAGFLPLGLSLDPSSGVLSGTPAGSGSHNFTVAATGSVDDCAGTRIYTLHVSQCAFTLAPSSAMIGSTAATIPVTIGNGCGDRTVTATAAWLHPAIDAAGTTVTIGVDANTSQAVRTANVLIGRRVFTVNQAGTVSTAPFGSLDTPSDGQQLSGSVAVSGWALDDLGVSRVRIVRDSVNGEPPGQVFIGNAVFVTGARPDVQHTYPSLPSSGRAGWGYLLLTNMLPAQGNGPFRIYAYADDAEGNSTLLGARTIIGANATGVTPFGAIDTPAQGEVVGGDRYINWGWALTPSPKNINPDGSTIAVVVDGVVAGAITYNLFRPDVAALFPGLANTGGAVGYRAIDTTALADGLHTIAWLVTDSAGAATGVGSRYFTVSNSADAMAPTSAVSAGFAAGLRSGSTDETRAFRIAPLERLTVPLADNADSACAATYAGYLDDRGELRALPIGSSLDPRGTFHWQPGPAFHGVYRLVFIRTACDGARTRIPVSVIIR